MGERLHVLISGRVQGVGFRYSTYHEAQALGLTGWVRNVSDGRVEAEFEGPQSSLEQMLSWCRVGPRLAKVTHVDVAWETGEPRHDAFRMRW